MDIGCLFWCFSLVFGVEALGKGLVWQVIEIHSRWNCVGPSKLCGHYAIEFPIKIWTAIFFLLFSSKLLEIKKIIIDWVNLEHVCFLKSSFQKITFQTFLYLFIIKKNWSTKNTFRSRENTFQSTETLSDQRKIWFDFQKSVFHFGCVCFSENGFREITFQIFLCLFVIRKVGQRKTLSSQRKIWLGFQESVFLENLDGKHFPEVVKNLEMSLFADYIKFDPQTFDCYI